MRQEAVDTIADAEHDLATARDMLAAGGPPFRMFGKANAEEAVAWATKALEWLGERLSSTS